MVNLHLRYITIILLFACLSSRSTASDWTEIYSSRVPSGQKLRGYGSVSTVTTVYRADNLGEIAVMRFVASSEANANTIVGKYLADLDQSAGVESTIINGYPVRRLPSGWILAGCIQGTEARFVSAQSEKAFSDLAGTQAGQLAGLLTGAVAQAPYPVWLDRFDHWGWGMYGLGGFNNYHNWMGKVDGKQTLKDPTKDYDWLIKNRYRFEPWLDPTHFDNGDGLIKNTESEWMVKGTREANQPISFRLYGAAGGAEWTARRFPEYMEQPAPFLMSGWHGADLFWKAQPHLSWFAPELHRYLALKAQEKMQLYTDEPHVMGWMHPHGELAHDPWYDWHDDYSPRARAHWQEYLKKQGITLAETAALFGHPDRPFGDWQQVPIPEYATLAGLNGRVLSLGGQWWWRRGRESNSQSDEIFPGIEQNWPGQALDTAKWKPIEVPGNDAIYAILPKALPTFSTTWFRRSFTLTADQLRTTPLYLYWFPISHGRIHSGDHARYHQVFINGEPAGGIGKWGALEVSNLLRSGENEIAVQLFGGVWNGRIFLSTEEPAIFPYLGSERNRLWLLWQNWHIDAKYDAWVDILEGMRQVDPARPIKFMAPIKFGADRWLKLASQYGGWPHFTGEGIWYFPWYKRYGYLYGLPGTSEVAGPANNLTDQFNSFRRTFLAGLDGHEAVFVAQTYTRNPELRKFWEDHTDILHRMGTYDIDGPQVLIYRSTKSTNILTAPKPHPELGQATRLIQSPWNWDIGRGTLQTLGHSYLYLDDGGLADGKMVGYDLMIDCGNESIPVESINQLKEWVEDGGTFVTLPFTGRNSLEVPDSWPIAALTGCQIVDIRPSGKDTITFDSKQSLFKEFAGHTFPDNGSTMDYMGNNLNQYSIALLPSSETQSEMEIIARFSDGTPVIIRRKLGRGQVIVLGTAFWRQAEDRMGIWWPKPIESQFFANLLTGIGFEKPVCTSSDDLVWAQPYRSNNGQDTVTCLVSWHEDKDVKTTLYLRLAQRPANLVSYGVDGVVNLSFTWKQDAGAGEAGTAVAEVTMPAKEVKVIAAAAYNPSSALSWWWERQQRYWHQLVEPTIDLTPYQYGKWADPVLDLRQDAEFSLDGTSWTPAPMSILNAYGAPPYTPVEVRKRFSVPAKWKANGGQILLISASWSGYHYMGKARLSLNGNLLHDYTTKTYNEFDVTQALLPGENTLVFNFKGDSEYSGFSGNVWLYYRPSPVKSIPLDSVWKATLHDKPITLTLPGKGQARSPEQNVFIPAEWEGRYTVRLYMQGTRNSVLGAMVNGRFVRRHHHGLGETCDIDITQQLRFGQTNRLVLPSFDNQTNWHISTMRLDLYPRAKEGQMSTNSRTLSNP